MSGTYALPFPSPSLEVYTLFLDGHKNLTHTHPKEKTFLAVNGKLMHQLTVLFFSSADNLYDALAKNSM